MLLPEVYSFSWQENWFFDIVFASVAQLRQ